LLGDGLSGYLTLVFVGLVIAFDSLCRIYPGTRLVFRNATSSGERYGLSRPLATRIRIEHRPHDSKSQEGKVAKGVSAVSSSATRA
jgi:hypothetical protein